MTDSSWLQGSIVALLTPMTLDGDIDFPAFEQLIDLHVEARTSAVVVASTTGKGRRLRLRNTCFCVALLFFAPRAGFR